MLSLMYPTSLSPFLTGTAAVLRPHCCSAKPLCKRRLRGKLHLRGKLSVQVAPSCLLVAQLAHYGMSHGVYRLCGGQETH